MAFQNNKLAVLIYRRGFTLWHYKTEDLKQDIMSGYFDEEAIKYLIHDGDVVVVNAGDANFIARIHINDGIATLSETNIGWLY